MLRPSMTSLCVIYSQNNSIDFRNNHFKTFIVIMLLPLTKCFRPRINFFFLNRQAKAMLEQKNSRFYPITSSSFHVSIHLQSIYLPKLQRTHFIMALDMILRSLSQTIMCCLKVIFTPCKFKSKSCKPK